MGQLLNLPFDSTNQFLSIFNNEDIPHVVKEKQQNALNQCQIK